MDLGPVGIWSGALRRGDPAVADEAVAELDELGFGTIWIPGGTGGDVLDVARRLLSATRRAVVATGILNVWMHDPTEVATEHAALAADYPGRFVLGLGVSHALAVERSHQVYERPLGKMMAYLDALDAIDPPVPTGQRVLAALGPRMLALARDRAAGAHPYLVGPEHTAMAREVLGRGPILAPEQMVVLETDPVRARAVARQHLSRYLELPNYTRNLLRTGYVEQDLAGGGSDRLVDGIVAWGDVSAIVGRVKAHHDAGADHVCLQVLLPDAKDFPRAEWRALAERLLSA
jgi:probable F420-dependent oxidoreductase